VIFYKWNISNAETNRQNRGKRDKENKFTVSCEVEKTMPEFNELYDVAIDTLKKILYPEEWIAIDATMSKTELFTLLQLDRNGEIMMSQMADYINIPMSTATGLVERLVRKGYVERVRSEEDRRIVTIRLTEEGKLLTENIKKTITGYLEYVFKELTEEEGELVKKIFLKVTGILSGKALGQTDSSAEAVGLRKIEIE
jgi:DNA-binding MarR family transcriptional regulator